MKREVRDHYNRIAGFYQGRKRKRYLNLLRKGIGAVQAERIIDLGCGTGLTLSWFQGEKVGVDFSLNLLEQAPSDVQRIAADVEALPFRNESFDYVLCVDVAEHLPSLMLIDEAYRILTWGGVLNLSTVDSRYSLPIEFIEKLGLKLPEGPHRWRKRDEILNKMRTIGFRVEDYLIPPIRFFRGTKDD